MKPRYLSPGTILIYNNGKNHHHVLCEGLIYQVTHIVTTPYWETSYEGARFHTKRKHQYTVGCMKCQARGTAVVVGRSL